MHASHDVVTTLLRLGDAAVTTALPSGTHVLQKYHVEKSLGDGSFGTVMSVRRNDWSDSTSAPGPFVAYCTQISALLNDYLAYNLMKTYARLQEGGNMRTFLALMLTFGKGATLTTVLMKLRTEKDVIITEDLSDLNHQGMKSIFLAQGGSKHL